MSLNLDEKVWGKIQEVFSDALGFDLEEILFDSRVIDDLEAESIDMLDILYRLDQAFGIKIPRGGLEKTASGEGEDDGIGPDGALTEDALKRLAVAMPEVPAEEFVIGLKPTDIPRLFRVGTFYNLVIKLLSEK